jgi:WD40 repeat protein
MASLDSAGAKVLSLVYCDGKTLASGGSDNVVRLWDIDSHQEIKRFVGHTGSVAALDANPTQQLLVSGSFDTTARIWKLDASAARSGPQAINDNNTAGRPAGTPTPAPRR